MPHRRHHARPNDVKPLSLASAHQIPQRSGTPLPLALASVLTKSPAACRTWSVDLHRVGKASTARSTSKAKLLAACFCGILQARCHPRPARKSWPLSCRFKCTSLQPVESRAPKSDRSRRSPSTLAIQSTGWPATNHGLCAGTADWPRHATERGEQIRIFSSGSAIENRIWNSACLL